MKLLSRNIAIRNQNNKEVVDFLREQNADIVCLQEVGKAQESSTHEEYDSFKAIYNSNLYPYWFIGESHEFKAFNGKRILDFGGYIRQWNMILSKYPILQATNIFYYRSFERREDFSNRRKTDSGRCLVTATIDINNYHLQIGTVHGIRTEDKKWDHRTLKQCKDIISIINKDIPTILAWDFNLLPTTPDIQYINQFYNNMINKYNISSTRPKFNDEFDNGNQIVDYIFTNNYIKDTKVYIDNNNISDHMPLIIEFNI